METAGGETADQVAPEALGGVDIVDAALVTVRVGLGAVNLGRVERPWLAGDGMSALDAGADIDWESQSLGHIDGYGPGGAY